MRRRKKYKLEFLTGIFEEWRFYTISEKMLIRSKEYEKAMKATYEHMVWVFMMGWNCIKSYR